MGIFRNSPCNPLLESGPKGDATDTDAMFQPPFDFSQLGRVVIPDEKHPEGVGRLPSS